MNIPEGILKKEVKSKEQKTKDIEEVRSQWNFRSTLLEACLKGGGGGGARSSFVNQCYFAVYKKEENEVV